MLYKYPSLRTTLPVAGYYARLDAGAAATDQFTADGAQDGTLTNGATRVDDGGLAYSFDGTNDYVTVPSQLIPTGASARTIAFWFKSTGTISTRQWLIYGGTEASFQRFGIEIESSKLTFNYFTNAVVYTTTLTANTWYHAAVVYNGGTSLSLFLNGTKQTFTLIGALNTGTSTNTRLGIFNNLTSFPFSGQMDDLVFYTTALSDSEVGYLAAQRGAIYATTNYKYPTLREVLPVAGYYARLDAGAAADDRFGSFSGTLSAGTTRVDNGGLCYRHNGSSSGITTTYTNPIGTSDYTLSSWFNVANVSQFGAIFAKDSQVASSYTQASTFVSNSTAGGTGRRITGLDYSSSGNILTTPTDGTYTNAAWHHVVLRRRTVTGITTVSLWINGTQIAAVTATLRNLNNTNPLKIGVADGPSLRLTGDTDDHLFWLSAISDADIGYLATERGAIYRQIAGGSPINGQSLIRPADVRPAQLLIG